jgi:hypothetical protein
MATYKVIQDIEAEDHFVGPLTLKQFIFACTGVLFGYLNIFALTKGAPVLMGLFLPPMFLGFFLAIPWSRDQPTELWLLGRVRFFIKPKKRIWNQAGVQELVTITAPKKEEKPLTKNYSQGEVKSRLKALAETIDSRGWAVKHSTLEESQLPGQDLVSDRLVSPSILPQQVPAIDYENVPDLLDPSSSPLSGDLDNMIEQKDTTRRNELLQKMDKARRGEPLQAEAQPNIAVNQSHAPSKKVPAAQNSSMDEQLLVKELQAKKQAGDLARSHMRGISLNRKPSPQSQASNGSDDSQSPQDTTQQPPDSQKAQAAMTSGSSPDTMRLANNNDLNIATLAREADRKGENGDGEVVISLR